MSTIANDKEIITLFIGQCGVQLGSAAWELLCVEHGLLPNGRTAVDVIDNSFRSFFQETLAGQYVPRTLLADLEPTVVDEVRTGTYRKLFHPDQLLSCIEDAANNFARGIHTSGRCLYDPSMNAIRKLVDQCNNISSFIIHNSFGGGTGSGFGCGLLRKIHDEYCKKSKIQIAITPAQSLSTAVVEPYNAILSVSTPIENIDVALLFDNEALYNICSKSLEIKNLTYYHINQLISQVLSSLTCSERFDGCLQSQLDQLQTNLVPFPRIHFPFGNYCPLLSQSRADHQSLSVFELSRNVFEKDSQLALCNLSDGKFMSCVMIYRGEMSPCDVNAAIMELKNAKHMGFVEWCPTGFKVAINKQVVTTLPASGFAATERALSAFSNHTAIVEIFKRLTRKFDLLYSKKAFVWLYVGEGMEEGELMESRDGLAALERDYVEITESLASKRASFEKKLSSTGNVDNSGNNRQFIDEINKQRSSITSVPTQRILLADANKRNSLKEAPIQKTLLPVENSNTSESIPLSEEIGRISNNTIVIQNSESNNAVIKKKRISASGRRSSKSKEITIKEQI